MNESLIDVSSTAKYLGVSPSWIRRHLPELPHIRLCGLSICFKRSDLDDWLENL